MFLIFYHRVEIYSVYGCLEYTLRHDPKSANFTTSFCKIHKIKLDIRKKRDRNVTETLRLKEYFVMYNLQLFLEK